MCGCTFCAKSVGRVHSATCARQRQLLRHVGAERKGYMNTWNGQTNKIKQNNSIITMSWWQRYLERFQLRVVPTIHSSCGLRLLENTSQFSHQWWIFQSLTFSNYRHSLVLSVMKASRAVVDWKWNTRHHLIRETCMVHLCYRFASYRICCEDRSWRSTAGSTLHLEYRVDNLASYCNYCEPTADFQHATTTISQREKPNSATVCKLRFTASNFRDLLTTWELPNTKVNL